MSNFLMKFFEDNCVKLLIIIIIQKIAPQAKSGKYFQIWLFPDLGGKLAVF